MVPSGFNEENGIADTPNGSNPDDIPPISIYAGLEGQGKPVIISCWKPTKAERDEIAKTGRVWLVVRGRLMPPVHLSGVSPFIYKKKGDKNAGDDKQ